MAHRTSEMFAYTAKQDGVVVGLTSLGIIVEYADKSKIGVNLGRVFGKAEGSVYPHDIVTKLSIGNKFKKGDVIAYNTGFFEEDFLDPKNIIMKTSMTVKTALLESSQTFEDSSSLSKSLSDKMSAKTTKVKSITVDFNQNVINPVKVGQSVVPTDVLMIIEDEITSTTSAFNEEALLALRRFSNQAPLAKYHGTIDKIEVFYHGEKEDMSSSIRALADQSDKMLANICKSTNKPIVTGSVNAEYRVSGVPLILDRAEIKLYITVNNVFNAGDKGIFANQMKSVIGQIMDYDMYTESGERIEAVFGFKSIANRIVLSPVTIGTTTTLLKLIAKQATKIYRG